MRLMVTGSVSKLVCKGLQYGYNHILSEAGVGTRGLILYEPISSYQEELTKKSKRHIEISVEEEDDTLLFVIEVSDNGNSNISVRSLRRERISYSGYMMLD